MASGFFQNIGIKPLLLGHISCEIKLKQIESVAGKKLNLIFFLVNTKTLV